MNKTLVAVSLLLSVWLSSAADGWLQFANTATTRIMTNTVSGGAATGPTSGSIPSYYFGLFVAPTSVRTSSGFDDPNWVFTGNYATNLSTVGRFGGGSGAFPYAVQVPGYAPGTAANFIVRGWSADFGADWTQVQQKLELGNYGSFYGESLVAQDIYLANLNEPLDNLFGLPSNGQMPGFTLNYMVPEPSAIALVTLGAVGFVARRRYR